MTHDPLRCVHCGEVLGEEADSQPKHGLGVCCFYNVMVDVETLGLAPNSAIVQIGAVRFDPFMGEKGTISSPEGSFNFHTKLTANPRIDGDLDVGTVLWWLKQDKDAQVRVFQPAREPTDHILFGIQQFAIWLRQLPFRYVWAAGPQFDLMLLKVTWERAINQNLVQGDRAWPITYGVERDFRTLKHVGRMLQFPEPLRVGTKHDALDDAHHQAAVAVEFLRRLKGLPCT